MAADGPFDTFDEFAARYAGDPEPRRSYYLGRELNKPIPLYEGRGHITWSDADGYAAGRVSLALRWLPNPHLEATLTSTGFSGSSPIPDEVTLNLSVGLQRSAGFGLDVPVEFLHSVVSDPRQLEATFIVREPVVVPLTPTPDVAAAEWVEVHLVNCARFGGEPWGGRTVEKVGASLSIGRMRFSVNNDEWRTVIDPVLEAPYQEAMLTSGYVITHVVEMRAVGRMYSPELLMTHMDELCGMLSLVSGSAVGHCLATGYNAQGRAVWNVWSAPPVQPWRGRLSAVPASAGSAALPHKLGGPNFSSLSLKYQQMRRDPEDAELLDRLSVWYLSALRHKGPAEVILAAAGLELAAYQYLVLGQGMRNFDRKLDTADALRLLISYMGETLSIPADLTVLTALAKSNGQDWDGPACVIGFRNALIHPPRGRSAKRSFVNDPQARGEAHALALHYFDLAILRLLDYEGVCFDRWSGAGSLVPWSPEPQTFVSFTRE